MIVKCIAARCQHHADMPREEEFSSKNFISYQESGRLQELNWDTGRETAIEWNTSEISASTSVFDITQNKSEELNCSVMSELFFGSSLESASSSTVPTQESIVADTLAAWEHEEFTPENITSSGKTVKKRTSTSKGTKRKHKQSILPNESFLSDTSENSINYSAIQSAVLLPNVSIQAAGNIKDQASNAFPNNTSLNNETSIINQTSIKLPIHNNEGSTGHNLIQSSSRSLDSSCTSESQLNSTYITSQNSSAVSDASSNQTVGETDASLISTTQKARKKKVVNVTLPNLPEEDKNKILNVPPKNAVKKKAAKSATKTKTKGTQVNIKTKAQKQNVAPKKTTGKKVVRKKKEENKNKKQENSILSETSVRENIIPGNDLNVNLGDPSNNEIKSKEVLLKEKVEALLNMPSTSHAVPDINNTIGAADDTIRSANYTISSSDLDQSGQEILVSQSCSIEIIKEANRASKINIILPPEANLSLSKKNAATVKSKKKVSTNNAKKDSLTAGSNNTPKQGQIKIKQEKPSPKSIDLTSGSESIKNKSGKEDTKEKGRHLRKSETPKRGNKKHEKRSPAHKTKRQTVACGYMSSSSSDESDESYDSSDGSSSCSCSDCADYCSCSFCEGSSSCSCSSCSESSYESPRRRRRHHR